MSVTKDVLEWAWDKKDWIRDRLREIRDWWRGPVDGRGILLLGPGGVGKTTLAKLLSGEYDFLLDIPDQYKEDYEVEHYSLPEKGGLQVEIVVPPGQQHRREATWSDLLQDVAGGKFRGVVLLCAYGYHTLGNISWKMHPLAKQHPDEASFLDAFLMERREDEIAVLNRLKPAMDLNSKDFWLLTVVTKQDLWWNDRIAVQKHYRQGRFGGVFQNVVNAQQQKRFRHELAFCSLVISNFLTGSGELLKPNREGYDHQLQVESLRELFQMVDALKNWEVRK